MQIKDHIITEARQLMSPNFNDRPKQEVSLIVIHAIALPPGKFEVKAEDLKYPWADHYIDLLFCNCLPSCAHAYFKQIEGMQVSSHLLVNRHGLVTQYVPFDKRAWHAGQSSYLNRDACNDYSIGIEMIGDDNSPFSDDQYDALIDIIHCIQKAYPETAHHPIVGHSDISPGRKTDPGPLFNWSILKQAGFNVFSDS